MAGICALELFGGAGGMALGFRRAGVEFALSVDADPLACATYERNMSVKPLQLDVHALAQIVRVGAVGSAIDLLVADPPSPTERRGPIDATIELIDLWRPTAFVISNTHALELGLGGEGRRREFCGYALDTLVLDAAAYGVGQHRRVIFWFGHKAGTPCLKWPTPTHGAPRGQLQIEGTELASYVSERKALEPLRKRGPLKRSRLTGPLGDKPAVQLTARAQARSLEAAVLLQGFPPRWRLVGASKSQRWAQVGQAVPPPLAEAVARSIVVWFAALRSDPEVERLAKDMHQTQTTALLPHALWSASDWNTLTDAQRDGWRRKAREYKALCAGR